MNDLVLVEGVFDYHQLRGRGVENVAAIGGTSTSSRLFERLSHLGVQDVTLCLDTDDAGRSATARAVEHSARARTSPAIYVAATDRAGAKDPDALVRQDGVEAWRALLEHRGCGIVWRAAEMVKEVALDAPLHQRREALGRAGAWLGSLAPRLALEQEDALQFVAEKCGYSRESVERAFRARFFRDMNLSSDSPRRVVLRPEQGVEL